LQFCEGGDLGQDDARVRYAANRLAALIVVATSVGGANADAVRADNTAATDPPENTMPRWVSRFASSTRARASRLATLPSGMPSCRAASLWVMSSRSHGMKTVFRSFKFVK
jgi:hypothetical protein